MTEQTIFEKILSGEIPSHEVGRGTNWYAFLDIFPRREGHTLVIPHEAVSHLSQLSDEQIAGLFSGVKEVQEKLGKVFSTQDFTICLHDGPLAGQEVPHVHVHVIPRTSGDGGLTLMSMWPKTRAVSEANHANLANLAKQIVEMM
ncbi:MAG TPA: HIT family protein [Candidatus Poseidoniales archaeon]|nr:HIT family hydrolase [Euryarchaeota archaeon]DAC26279.1 MAG TPA: HIT family protein [Candidatus Poseidoniales archaeon]HII58665.1 HIT family protein [Candidatus Poseidoniaceae archaeon]|tara:strand:- start:53 stop:487 length:435 start_codon:yes stop_codon:yes gene_type:complete